MLTTSGPTPHFQYNEETNGVSISVLPTYVEEKSSPDHGQYFYSYEVIILNCGDQTLQLLNRHWIIRDGMKSERFINGEGVIGKRPYLKPGEEFSYQSFCPMSTPTGNMRGKFQFKDEDNNLFWAKIPVFFFRPPSSFHQ